MKQRALSALVWSGSDLLARQGVQFATTLVLARLLTPADFGLVAMLAVFVALASTIADGGLSIALIQRQDADQTDASTVFWFNALLGGVATFALIALAPLVAGFYRIGELEAVIRVLAWTVLINALGAVHAALLTKQLNFRSQAIAGLVAALVSGSCAIGLAIKGFGVWALVAQSLCMAMTMTLALWLLNAWRPSLVFSAASLAKLLGFGAYQLASTLLETAYARLHALLIGRVFGPTDLGLYANADNTRQIPQLFLGGLVARVTLPVFSKSAEDPEKLRRGLRLSNRAMMLLNAPLMLGGAALAAPLIRLLFGEQWVDAAELLQILCLASLLYPLHLMNVQALMAQGKAALMFRLEVIKKIAGVVLVAVGLYWGVQGIAWSQVALSLLALWINTYYTKKFLGYGLAAQIRDVKSPVLAATLMAALVVAFARYVHDEDVLALFGLIGLGALIYVGVLALNGSSSLKEVSALLKQRHSS